MFSEKAKSRLDVFTNILTIIAAIVFLAMVVQYYFPSGKPSNSSLVGRSVTMAGFDPQGSSKNVLLVMMKGCHFCEESMGFYRTLLENNKGNQAKFIAVFPAKDGDIGSYLDDKGITGLEISYSEISGIEIEGTPTLIVTDQGGKIIGSWFGKLKPAKEAEVSALLAQ